MCLLKLLYVCRWLTYPLFQAYSLSMRPHTAVYVSRIYALLYLCVRKLRDMGYVSYDLLYVYVSHILVRCICVSDCYVCVCVTGGPAGNFAALKLLVHEALSY